MELPGRLFELEGGSQSDSFGLLHLTNLTCGVIVENAEQQKIDSSWHFPPVPGLKSGALSLMPNSLLAWTVALALGAMGLY